jgi:hypothetical protein
MKSGSHSAWTEDRGSVIYGTHALFLKRADEDPARLDVGGAAANKAASVVKKAGESAAEAAKKAARGRPHDRR